MRVSGEPDLRRVAEQKGLGSLHAAGGLLHLRSRFAFDAQREFAVSRICRLADALPLEDKFVRLPSCVYTQP
jgi:predicted ATPase